MVPADVKNWFGLNSCNADQSSIVQFVMNVQHKVDKVGVKMDPFASEGVSEAEGDCSSWLIGMLDGISQCDEALTVYLLAQKMAYKDATVLCTRDLSA